ncbi:sulfatase [Halobellus inordinatus]|uniref:sulfatase n=1 Tax=Halobellus inordinatus TaxID=1126236 RepID=UPI00210B5CA0|nr:sulfatase [Halobellus inordinatus]
MTRRPNVVWITLDSVRQDHTSMAGYRRDTTPHLERIGNGSASQSFSNAFSQGIWTLASSASILTGTYPSHHRVGFDSERLGDELRTVAELFKDEGYHTACLSRNTHLSSATNLDRGFDDFKWIASSTLLREAGVKTTLKYLLNIRRHSAGLTRDPAKHATPFVMNDLAKDMLDRYGSQSEPFFFYLHYNEPHRPYYPPLPFLNRYTEDIEMSPKEAADFAMWMHYNLHEAVANGCDFTDEQWEALFAMYDAEIAYTDECIGRLYDYVQSLDLNDTIFVVTADHGELFGEGGMLAHKVLLDDALINVPLVLDGLDLDAEDFVQHVDIMQTILERIGADTTQLQGVSLDSSTRDHVITQRGAAEFDPFLEANPDFDVSRYHEPPLSCLRTRKFKYQRSADGEDLYHLPDESADVAEMYPEVHDELRSRLEVWLETDGAPVSTVAEAEFTDAMKRQLRDLGYVE